MDMSWNVCLDIYEMSSSMFNHLNLSHLFNNSGLQGKRVIYFLEGREV